MENKETNLLLGGERQDPMSRKQRQIEKAIDGEKAREEMVGRVDEKIMKEMEKRAFVNFVDEIRKKDEMLAKTVFAEKLKNNLEEQFGAKVKIHTVVGTVLDSHFKVSALVTISVSGAPRGMIFVSIDTYTENDNKRKGADVLIRKPECGFDNEGSDQFLAVLTEATDDIVAKIQARMEKYRVTGNNNHISDNSNVKINWGNKGAGRRVVKFK